MKSFAASAVIAAVMVCGGILFNVCIKDISSDFCVRCGEIEEEIQNGNFEKAVILSGNLSDSMEERKLLLASIINHENIDEIEMCIAELCGYAEYADSAEAMLRCRKLEHLFEHLPSNYGIKPQNIL